MDSAASNKGGRTLRARTNAWCPLCFASFSHQNDLEHHVAACLWFMDASTRKKKAKTDITQAPISLSLDPSKSSPSALSSSPTKLHASPTTPPKQKRQSPMKQQPEPVENWNVPECPVFRPTPEEFSQPLVYISKIRQEAERYGICRIIPPSLAPTIQSCVDPDTFTFRTKVQNVHQFKNRNNGPSEVFSSSICIQLAKRGINIIDDYPQMEGRDLDLYNLFLSVVRRGGYMAVTEHGIWGSVAHDLRLSDSSREALIKLQTCYHQFLHFYEASLREKVLQHTFMGQAAMGREAEEGEGERKRGRGMMGTMGGDHEGPPQTIEDAMIRYMKHEVDNTNFVTDDEADEFGFYDGGKEYTVNSFKRMADAFASKWFPTMPTTPLYTYAPSGSQGEAPSTPPSSSSSATTSTSPLSTPTHNYSSVLPSPPTSTSLYNTPTLSPLDLSLPPSPSPSPTSIESEFWRIIEASEESVQVQYGSDIDVTKHGSGFPMTPAPSSSSVSPSNSNWNLNHFPRMEGSVLRTIPASIVGVTSPMMYVGMLFSSFCWHTEDNYLYSINYLHHGANKMWYGIPASASEQFEEVMKRSMPQLFERHPDLLHMLVTMISPGTLKANGVSVCRTLQHPGEFVITFPQAYHAGFSHGFTVGEAVNFAPADWLPFGAQSIEHYRNIPRSGVFSHEQLVMMLASSSLAPEIAAWVLPELMRIKYEETRERMEFTDLGTGYLKIGAAPTMGTDPPQCKICEYDCYLSSVSCICGAHVVCLRHAKDLCTCPMSMRTLTLHVHMPHLDKTIDRIRSHLSTPNTPTTTTTTTLIDSHPPSTQIPSSPIPSLAYPSSPMSTPNHRA
eukprot:TRINITY_DN2125_c0_g1_i1.p1 TRINITY_DN2125_c0_g1~~TRINITY_DN2125_c0_g1_i1.p1  ORF type:complete len:842 (+),score=204.27 TRINITY_DN2125_c0_g1_i1:177-2702(+)